MTGFPEDWLSQPLFALSQKEREARLMPHLRELTTHHAAQCPAYRKMIEVAFPDYAQATNLADLPYLPVSFFKNRSLRSVASDAVRVTIRSSGTTGAAKSRIDMDGETTRLSARTLAATLRQVIGPQRLPMLIIDAQDSLDPSGAMGARSAAILGLMPFGADHCFALDADMTLSAERVRAFLAKHGRGPFLIYGFTFLVWQTLAQGGASFDLSRATLLHSGGWKTLAEQRIDNAAFKARLRETTGLSRIVNFYGMAEMPGAIFVENDNGLLYPPAFADVLIRDPQSFAPLPHGKVGLVQIFNLTARSFAGHALLTEDMGVIESLDAGANGWQGKGLRLLGRAPKTALRGCSDVIAAV